MGIREVFRSLVQGQSEKKEMIRQMDNQVRMQRVVEDRQKSANERELERFMEEERQEIIKEELEFRRKERQEDINFGHNPLDAENIITKKHWEVLKEKNQFAGKGNMFSDTENIHKDNPKLLRNNQKLLKGGNMFKI